MATYAYGLGSVRLATDSAGGQVGAATYEPWGAPKPGSATLGGFGYTGEQTDAETGLVYLRARHYDPASGRFTNAHSLGFMGSDGLFSASRRDVWLGAPVVCGLARAPPTCYTVAVATSALSGVGTTSPLFFARSDGSVRGPRRGHVLDALGSQSSHSSWRAREISAVRAQEVSGR